MERIEGAMATAMEADQYGRPSRDSTILQKLRDARTGSTEVPGRVDAGSMPNPSFWHLFRLLVSSCVREEASLLHSSRCVGVCHSSSRN